MANYMFRRADNLAAFHSLNRLGTDSLNALGSLKAAGHLIAFDADSIEEGTDAMGEFALLQVSGVREAGWHELPDVGQVLSQYGVRVAVFGDSAE